MLYVASFGMFVAWITALDANLDRADRTGGGISAFAGSGWWAAAVVAAVAATIVIGRGRRPAIR